MLPILESHTQRLLAEEYVDGLYPYIPTARQRGYRFRWIRSDTYG